MTAMQTINPVHFMRNFGLEPDPWQSEVLQGRHPRLLLNCCRQAGKSTTIAVMALYEILYNAFTQVLILSRSHRQSKELLRVLADFHSRLGAPIVYRRTAQELTLSNYSRVISLPCKEETVRGYANIGLLIIDEAARVPEDLYRAVRPMLAVSSGRLICLSTPQGKRGFFYKAWAEGGDDWHRVQVPAALVPRIKPEFLAEERRALGESSYRQEYCCSFEALQGLVYPNFARCVVAALPPHLRLWDLSSLSPSAVGPAGAAASGPDVPRIRRVGGIDFGFRNPFAAVWGIVDGDGHLWLTGEHYSRQRPLSHHAAHLPRGVTWYADPSGANERAELRCAGFVVHKGDNVLPPGIAAVSARLEAGTLHILEGRCPNLVSEAELYRYEQGPEGRGGEVPVDEYNHALAALRYLVSRLDERHMARPRSPATPATPPAAAPRPPQVARFRTFRDMWRDDELWTSF
jgi:hypothetical protein